MPRFIRRNRPNHSLLNRTYGRAARIARDSLGASNDARIEALLERVDRLERELAYGHRHFKGFLVGDSRIPVRPDIDGWLRIYSDDDSIRIERNPNKLTSVLDLTAPAECECCAENMTYTFNSVGCPCLTITHVGTVGCVASFSVDLDCDCLGAIVGGR